MRHGDEAGGLDEQQGVLRVGLALANGFEQCQNVLFSVR